MKKVGNNIVLGEDTEKTAISEGGANGNIDATGPLDHAKWITLCFGAASKSEASSKLFRADLIKHLNSEGVNWVSLFCHVQSADNSYHNAWANNDGSTFEMTTISYGGFFFTAFLTYAKSL